MAEQSLSESWYAVYTRACEEKRARDYLLSRAIETLWPLVLVRYANRIERERAVFPRYLFCNADMSGRDYYTIRNGFGVSRIVEFAGSPAQVPLEVIEEVKSRIAAGDGYVSLEKPRPVYASLEQGDRLKVVLGQWTGCQGLFDRKRGSERVRVLLEIMGGKMPFECDRGWVERVVAEDVQ